MAVRGGDVFEGGVEGARWGGYGGMGVGVGGSGGGAVANEAGEGVGPPRHRPIPCRRTSPRCRPHCRGMAAGRNYGCCCCCSSSCTTRGPAATSSRLQTPA